MRCARGGSGGGVSDQNIIPNMFKSLLNSLKSDHFSGRRILSEESVDSVPGSGGDGGGGGRGVVTETTRESFNQFSLVSLSLYTYICM